MDTLLQDLRYSVRRLLKRPGFALVVIATLGLGIGANTAIFSVVKSVLLAPLPYPAPDRLMMVWETKPAANRDRNVVNPQNYLDWQQRNTSFTALGLYTWMTMTLTGGGHPENVMGRAITPNVLDILGVRPALGRNFTREEGLPNAGMSIILSDGLWRRRFGADSSIMGRTITVSGGTATIVGVMPPTFRPLANEQYWQAFRLDPADHQRNGRYAMTIGRLRPGVTREQAQADMSGIARRLATEFPDFDTGWGARVVAMKDDVIGSARGVLLMLMGAVAVVLLITCANVGNLMLGHAASRDRELAVRTALGAPGWRLVRQWLVENVVLALAGGVVALGLAVWGVDLLLAAHPDSVPRLQEIRLDRSVLLVTALVSIGVGVLIGLPAAFGGRLARVGAALRNESARTTEGRRAARFRGALVVAQVSLALVLLIGAGLLVRSIARLSAVDPGFNPDKVLTFTVDLPPGTYPDSTPGPITNFYARLLEQLRAHPGVRAAGAVTWLPLTGIGAGTGFEVIGRPRPLPGQEPGAVIRVVDPQYLATIGIPLIRGRGFTDRDAANAPPVVLVSSALARKIWPTENPLGQHLKVSWTSPDAHAEVVGVVGDALATGLDGDRDPTIYFPLAQSPMGRMSVVVRTSGPPLSVVPEVRNVIHGLDPDLPVESFQAMSDVVTSSMADRRYPMFLLMIFAAVALLVAAIGVYAVLAFAVNQRTREIGIRMALGAQRRQVLRLILRNGLGLTLAGLALGVVGGAFASRALSRLLFRVAPADPVTTICVVLVLFGVAMLAMYLPARRATRVDPMSALRND
jgi:putative ABC transport system permease protein